MSIEQTIKINGIDHWVKSSIKHNSRYPIIAVHGGPGGFHYVFEDTPGKYLEEKLDIIYYEQRGCGRSAIPLDNCYEIDALISDLDCLIEKLGYEKVVLLGYSFGSELIIEYSLKHPDKVHKLILQAPSDLSDMRLMYEIQKSGFESLNIKFDELETDDIIEKYDYMWSSIFTEDVNKFLFYDSRNAIQVRKLWVESGMANNREMSKVIFNRKRDETVVASSSKIYIPTLIIVGKHDKNVGLELPTRYHKNIKGSILVILEKSAHFPDYEQSTEYIEVVYDFVLS